MKNENEKNQHFFIECEKPTQYFETNERQQKKEKPKN